MTNLGFTHVKDVSPNLEEVQLRGWVYRIRKMKGKIFSNAKTIFSYEHIFK